VNIQEAKAQAAAQGTRVVHLKRDTFTRRIDRATVWGNPHPLKGQSEGERTACLLAYVRTLSKDEASAGSRWRSARRGAGLLVCVDTVEERRGLRRASLVRAGCPTRHAGESGASYVTRVCAQLRKVKHPGNLVFGKALDRKVIFTVKVNQKRAVSRETAILIGASEGLGQA